jgi:RHS repeat-associated protein
MTFNATPPTQTYNYDQENRLTGAAGYAYTYDADGNRVKKSNASTGTLYWYMAPGIVAESDLSGALKSEYMFFDGQRVARKDFPGNAVAYYFSDHLKTASVITDSAGNIKAESDYYPWGGELQFSNNDTNHFKFGGHEQDSETGLYNYGARYYSNGLGRFISADWSAKPVPVPYADLSNPQTLNQYAYVGGNPASKADPDGHCCWEELKSFGIGVAKELHNIAAASAVSPLPGVQMPAAVGEASGLTGHGHGTGGAARHRKPKQWSRDGRNGHDCGGSSGSRRYGRDGRGGRSRHSCERSKRSRFREGRC